MTSNQIALKTEPLPGGRTRVSVRLGEVVIAVDELDLALQSDRDRFLKKLVENAPALEVQSPELERRLLEAAVNALSCGPSSVNADFPPSTDPKVVSSTEPLRLAEHYLYHREQDSAGRLRLRRYSGSFWRWDGSCYRELTDEQAHKGIYLHLDQLHKQTLDKDGKQIRESRVVANSKCVHEVSLALPACNTLVDGSPPFWIQPAPDAVDPTELMCCANGLVNLRTGELMQATPNLFSTVAVPFAYDPHAPAPERWLDFLNDVWGDDPESMACLQEWFGYLVTADTRMQKILLIVGPRRSGKGTIGRVLTQLVGQSNVASPTLATLAGDFGMQDLAGKSVALISDARLTGRADQTAVVERLLTISGEDLVTVNRKYKPPTTMKLSARFVVLTNELPRLTDVSGALAARFVVLQTRKSFQGREDVGLLQRILPDLPGILKWALEGRRRLMERAGFRTPESSAHLLQLLEELGSPIQKFIDECCEVGQGKQVACGVLYDRYSAWCTGNGVATDSQQLFGRNLNTAVPGVTRGQITDNGQRLRVYRGIGLRDVVGDSTRLHTMHA